MSYIKPQDVISPKAHWHLVDVVLDRKEGNCAYALGTWDGERRIGFRWSGDRESGPLGNPQSRGLPTWTILDPALYEAVVALLPLEKQVLAKSFLGLRTAVERRSIITSIRKYHEEQVAKIVSQTPPVALVGGATLAMHVVPFSAIDSGQARASGEIFRNPDKFPPIGDDHGRDSKIDYDGLLVGSNRDGLGKLQRAYVHVFRSGTVESVVSSLARGRQTNFIDLPKIQAMIVQYARFYAISLFRLGIGAPMAVVVSLLGAKGMRLLQDFATDAMPEDLPFGLVNEDRLHFGEAVFESIPSDNNESARMLDQILHRMANTAGLPSSPYFDADGNYVLKFKVGLPMP